MNSSGILVHTDRKILVPSFVAGVIQIGFFQITGGDRPFGGLEYSRQRFSSHPTLRGAQLTRHDHSLLVHEITTSYLQPIWYWLRKW